MAAENKLQKLNKQLFKQGINIKIVFITFKWSYFSPTKDKVPYGLKSFKICSFLCAGWSSSYVGETYRHISTRIHENLGTGKKSSIYQHLHENL